MSETNQSEHSGRAWTDDEVQQLRDLAAGNTPVGVMSMKLNRTEDAVRSKAQAAVRRSVEMLCSAESVRW
jgi:hypothetical protein